MKDTDRQTRSHLMQKFQERGFHPRHDLGQNFLIDLNLLDYVVLQAELEPDDVVLEIGTGTGSMTTSLAREAGAVVSVEIDARMHALAREATAGYPNVTLLHCDVLKNKNHFEPQVLETVRQKLKEFPEARLKLVANLPYSVATPVVSNLVETDLPWSAMVITIQWELAERMRAQPATADYGALSVWLQAQADVKVLKKLGPTVFWPRPQVDSAIVRLTAAPELREQIGDRAFFHDFIRRLFHHRRKSVRSVLSGMYRKQLTKPEVDALLQQQAIPEGMRAEKLEVGQLVELSRLFSVAVKSRKGS
jgi:16S rRNA (adenine1518-N6/adenine1519-N6)-dimethyltransferase